jgi:NAD(P)-dependent dehydrogenase (short-subunit alcohol dehydrogenase family)
MQLLLAGASGGIGLAMLRQLLREERWQRVYALYRRPSPALETLAKNEKRLRLLQVDLSSDEDLQALPEKLEGALNWVINTTGLLHDSARGLQPEKSLQQLARANLMAGYEVNAINHLLLLRALEPRLARRETLKIASLSARVGSIGDNRLGGWYGYRASKAALNQLMHTLAIEMTRLNRQSVCVTLHPGTTDTGLSRPFQGRVPPHKLFTPEFAAGELLAVLERLTPAQTGRCYAWDGEAIPW